MADREELYVDYQRSFVATVIVGSFAAASLSFTLLGKDVEGLIWGLIGIPLFIFSGIYWTRIIFDSKPRLLIGAKGVRYRGYSEISIPWCEIEDAHVVTIPVPRAWPLKSTLIRLWLRDPSRYPIGQGMPQFAAALQRLFMQLQSRDRNRHGDISIPVWILDKSTETIMSTIREKQTAKGS